MEITIKDDFDLEKIRLSGQCFRIKKLECKDKYPIYTAITRNSVLLVKQKNKNSFFLSCNEHEWTNTWATYFDMKRNYKEIRAIAKNKNAFVDSCLNFGAGLRILRQDSWEMLITFIISQRKSMPAIATSVDKLCNLFGDTLSIKFQNDDCSVFPKGCESLPGNFQLFPTAEQLCNASLSDIQKSGVGYRAEYIKDAARFVQSGEIDLDACKELDDEKLFEELCKTKGVGKKVANCIMLFGYGRVSRAPIDVWIERVINENFRGTNPFPDYGEIAGIIQQYLFFYKTQTH